MLRVLKFPYLKEKYWFWSDIHGLHKDFIWKPRGFSSQKEHDDTLLARINEKLDNECVLFLLGDSAFTENAEEMIWRIFSECNFKEMFISPGNHAAGFKQIYYRELEKQFGLKEQEVYPLKMMVKDKIVNFMPNYYEIKIGSTNICMCHFPIISHSGEGKGNFHLAGHSHGNLKFTQKDYKQGKRLDLSVEQFPYPQSLESIIQIMSAKQAESFDHH